MQEGKKKKLMLFFVISLLLFNAVTANESEKRQPIHGKHFVLIHGACHGAWSWYKLVALLRSSGHNVTALYLAASGINPKQVNDIPSISDYLRPLIDFMASLPQHDRVVLVSHSFGGLAISLAMESFPEKISVAVFITALMPVPTLNISTLNQESLRSTGSDLQDSRYRYGEGPNNPPISFIFGPLYLSANVYQHSPIEDLVMGTLLIRTLRLYNVTDMASVLMLTRQKYGSVSRVFIVSGDDKLSKKEFQQWMIKKNPPDEVEEISSFDHTVMMSRPVELLLAFSALLMITTLDLLYEWIYPKGNEALIEALIQ